MLSFWCSLLALLATRYGVSASALRFQTPKEGSRPFDVGDKVFVTLDEGLAGATAPDDIIAEAVARNHNKAYGPLLAAPKGNGHGGSGSGATAAAAAASTAAASTSNSYPGVIKRVHREAVDVGQRVTVMWPGIDGTPYTAVVTHVHKSTHVDVRYDEQSTDPEFEKKVPLARLASNSVAVSFDIKCVDGGRLRTLLLLPSFRAPLTCGRHFLRLASFALHLPPLPRPGTRRRRRSCSAVYRAATHRPTRSSNSTPRPLSGTGARSSTRGTRRSPT